MKFINRWAIYILSLSNSLWLCRCLLSSVICKTMIPMRDKKYINSQNTRWCRLLPVMIRWDAPKLSHFSNTWTIVNRIYWRPPISGSKSWWCLKLELYSENSTLYICGNSFHLNVLPLVLVDNFPSQFYSWWKYAVC